MKSKILVKKYYCRDKRIQTISKCYYKSQRRRKINKLIKMFQLSYKYKTNKTDTD